MATIKKTPVYAEYIYSFKGGGWNSEYAKTKAEAKAMAKKRWKGSDIGNRVDYTSFSRTTEKEFRTICAATW